MSLSLTLIPGPMEWLAEFLLPLLLKVEAMCPCSMRVQFSSLVVLLVSWEKGGRGTNVGKAVLTWLGKQRWCRRPSIPDFFYWPLGRYQHPPQPSLFPILKFQNWDCGSFVKMPRGLEVSLPEELQPAVLEPALIVDWLARCFSLWLLLCGSSLKML